VIALLEWLDRKCGGPRRLSWNEQRFADHLMNTTVKPRRGKWL
jgi:hypothetical protein